MFKYEYEKVRSKISGLGVYDYVISKHKEKIDQRAKDGWRYVGFIPTHQNGSGTVEEIELIFEKDIED